MLEENGLAGTLQIGLLLVGWLKRIVFYFLFVFLLQTLTPIFSQVVGEMPEIKFRFLLGPRSSVS